MYLLIYQNKNSTGCYTKMYSKDILKKYSSSVANIYHNWFGDECINYITTSHNQLSLNLSDPMAFDFAFKDYKTALYWQKKINNRFLKNFNPVKIVNIIQPKLF